jgi:AcrR family transcriptional regulator
MDKPVRTRRREERPGEILEAAFEEFVQKGYAGTRLEDVAARAGVTKGTIYFYFHNKEQVFVTMVREISRPMIAQAEQIFAHRRQETTDISDFLRSYLRFFYQTVVTDRRAGEILRLLIAEAGRFPHLADEHFQNFVGPALAMLREVLGEGASTGRLRRTPATEFPELLLAPALQLNIWLLAFAGRRPVDAERHCEAAIDLIMHGLLPRPDHSSGSAGLKGNAK